MRLKWNRGLTKTYESCYNTLHVMNEAYVAHAAAVAAADGN